MKNAIIILLLFISTILKVNAQEPSEFIYKQIDTTTLKMTVYKPVDFKPNKLYSCIVFFFGGGWNSGSTNQFKSFAMDYAAKGYVTILPDYRVKSRQGTTPFESLNDAKSAIRFIRENAKKLNVNPKKIIASGGSAGGQLAAACFTNVTINECTDNLKISSKPNFLILFNPVVDNSKDGYGYERVKEHWKEFSPLHNIEKGFPPSIFILGTKDHLIPVRVAQQFKQKVDSVGSHCDIYLYENQDHGFFNNVKFKEDIYLKMDAFLKKNKL